MKKILLLAIAVILCGCAAEMPDCFRNAGAKVQYEVPVSDFTTIKVLEGVEVVLAQGNACKVVIETGEHLKKEISATVAGNELLLQNSSSCNWVRDYNSTTIYVTAPDISKIYSASQFSVRSLGVLSYPSLLLQSGLFGSVASGTYNLELHTESLIVEDNQSAYFKISGSVASLQVHFYSGDSRFDGSGLLLQDIDVFHRSSNDIIAAPAGNVTGTLYSTGNLVLKSHPASVQVSRLYLGEVRFE